MKRIRTYVFMMILLPGFTHAGRTQVLAQADGNGQIPTAKLHEMSLEKLLDMEVTSATKTKGFSVSKAPSVIRVFTRADIEKYNFRTVREVLINVPGVQMQVYRNGHDVAWFRGVKSRYNNKVLFLIDGVPVRDSYYGHSGIDEIIPIEIIDRIEIINGPGSVLYGANAFAGVVNITTKSARNTAKEQRAVRAAWGTYGTFKGSADFSAGNLYAFSDYYRTSGYLPELNNDGRPYLLNHEVESPSGFLKWDSEHYQGTFSYTGETYPERFSKNDRDRYWERNPLFGSFRYRNDLGGKAALNVLGYFESYQLRRDEIKYDSNRTVTGRSREFQDTFLYGVDVDVSHTIKSNNLIAGASFQGDQSNDVHISSTYPTPSTGPALVVPDVKRQNIGVFLQDIWSLNKNIDVTAGIRYDYLSDFDNQFNYRVALTAQKANLYSKVIFGTAFRVPSYKEYLDVDVYNLSLAPEHMKTFEAQVGHKFSRGDVNVTLFSNGYRDLIREFFVRKIVTPAGVRDFGKAGKEYAVNVKSSRITGLEFSATWRPVDEFTISGGFAPIFSHKEEMGQLDSSIVTMVPISAGQTDVTFLSDYTFNLMADFRIPRTRHSFGAVLNYMSDRLVSGAYQSGVPAAVRNPSNADGFAKLDIYANVHLFRNLDLRLKGANILDKKIFSPPFDDPAKYDSQWPGRVLLGELVFHY